MAACRSTGFFLLQPGPGDVPAGGTVTFLLGWGGSCSVPSAGSLCCLLGVWEKE